MREVLRIISALSSKHQIVEEVVSSPDRSTQLLEAGDGWRSAADLCASAGNLGPWHVLPVNNHGPRAFYEFESRTLIKTMPWQMSNSF